MIVRHRPSVPLVWDLDYSSLPLTVLKHSQHVRVSTFYMFGRARLQQDVVSTLGLFRRAKARDRPIRNRSLLAVADDPHPQLSLLFTIVPAS